MAVTTTRPAAAECDAAAVGDLAGLLEISEYAVFELAHSCWFGRDASSSELSGYFGQYLSAGDVPAWVRHYCRSPQARRAQSAQAPVLGFEGLAAACLYFVFCAATVCSLFSVLLRRY